MNIRRFQSKLPEHQLMLPGLLRTMFFTEKTSRLQQSSTNAPSYLLRYLNRFIEMIPGCSNALQRCRAETLQTLVSTTTTLSCVTLSVKNCSRTHAILCFHIKCIRSCVTGCHFTMSFLSLVNSSIYCLVKDQL